MTRRAPDPRRARTTRAAAAARADRAPATSDSAGRPILGAGSEGDAPRLLEVALRTPVTVGTNVKDRIAGAAWTFLLPSLELDRVLVVGAPAPIAVETLSRLAREVRVVPDPGSTGHAPPVAGPFDLVWLAAGPHAASHSLVASLADQGVLVADTGPRLPGRRHVVAPSGSCAVAIRPVAGELASAVAEGDGRAASWLRMRGLAGPPVRLSGRLGGHAARLLDRRPFRRLIPPRTIQLTGPGIDRERGGGPPAYLRLLAEAAGVRLDGWRWALAAPGRYQTQKILVLLAPPDAAEPSILVKLTRDPAANDRLETERDALRALEATVPDLADRAPRVVFAGRHADLAVVGETAIPGRPLRAALGVDDGSALIDDAVEWLGQLGERTASLTPGPDVAAALGELLARFGAVHAVHDEELRVLGAAVERVAAADRLPLVFEHGDAGTWNMLAVPGGHVVLLDWENATRLGMPVWDLLYLLRSLAVGSRKAGRRRIDAAAAAWLPGSPVETRLRSDLPRYCARVGLDPALVPALFQLCWMYHALKEASRMPRDRLAHGHYRRLLRRTIADRDRLIV